MSCDTSPRTASSPPINFHSAAFTCSSPSCRKRKRDLEVDEVRPHNLRSHQQFVAQDDGIYNYMVESISEKLKVERELSRDPLPPITCSPQSMKRTRGTEDENYLNNLQLSKRYMSQMMTSGLNGLNVKDFSIRNLMESPAGLESICNKSDDDFSAEVSGNSDSPHHLITSEENISYSKSPARSHAQQSDLKPDILQVPRSPSDKCQNRNLRRTALLRSIKMHDHHSHCVLPFGRDEENEAFVVRTSQDNGTAAARSRLYIETLDGFLSQKCHL